MRSVKVLWFSPTFNHYKAKFLNHLSKEEEIDLTVVSGTGRLGKGDEEANLAWSFHHVRLTVSKKKFGNSKLVRSYLKSKIESFDWVMIPAEKKNLPLFIYSLKLKKKNSCFKLFSYNHPILKSRNGKVTILDKWLTKYYFRKLDRVIFYTEKSHQFAVTNNLVNSKKAFWVNNTIDTSEIDEQYNFVLPPKDKTTILFIGRLIVSKRLDILFKYYNNLKDKISNLTLEVIGDGPQSDTVKSVLEQDANVIWHGTLINESEIAPIMTRSSIVFVPGHSGLSINHAFAYGRPYVTLQGPSHAPELDYIENGINGYVLEDNFEYNLTTIKDLLCNRQTLELFCKNANSTGDKLSVEKWVNKMKTNLLHE